MIAGLIFSSFFITTQLSFVSGYSRSTHQSSTLTIYTYDSLINWGLDATDANYRVFDVFEDREDCTINLEYFSDAPEVLARAVAEKNSPNADIVIGIDNVMISEAKAQEILIPYEPSTKANLSVSAINGLDPDFYVTPYDYGLITLIYHNNLVNSTTVSAINNLKLSDLTEPEVAKMLLVEDPTLSSTGLGFLMWTIGVYEKVLNKSWTTWWNATLDYIQIEKSWTEAFDIFYDPVLMSERPIMVSYGTDPAYNYLMYDDTSVGATVSHENNSNYAWLQIEGLGILKGTKNLELSQKFIDWFTGVTVQEVIPENNWMYPANVNATLPESFEYAIDPNDITPLNDLFNPWEIALSLDDWRDTWEEIVILGQKATPFPSLSFILWPFVLIILVTKKRRRNLK
jgi:thiamine transport system substrate-binding protein